MKNALMTILKSKKFLLGISGLIIPIIMKLFSIDDPALAEKIWMTACLLIVGQSAADWGKNS
jgi:hypothetical protein|tara:strand:+ start:809 stop:994 length:186 start_codon:yes stop_codon:yes gene_type:complete